jgi:hypothetical protein
MFMYPIVAIMAQADELPLRYAGAIDVCLTQGQLRALFKVPHMVHRVRPGIGASDLAQLALVLILI